MVDLPPVKQSYNLMNATDLKSRPIKSSLGVLPARRSESIPELNLVHLRGRSIVTNDDPPLSSRIGTNTPQSPRHLESPTGVRPHERRQPLPAILPMVGTTHTATLQERHTPIKPLIHIPAVKRRKIDLVVIEHDESDSPRSLIHRMVDEARLISQPMADRMKSQHRQSNKQPSSLYPHPPGLIVTASDDPSRAAVENLIASIKSKQLQEAQRQSDRKILDIIHRVLGRTVDLVYDEDEQERLAEQLEAERLREEQWRMDLEEANRAAAAQETESSPLDVDPDVDRDDADGEELDDIDEREPTVETIESVDDTENIDMSHDPLYRHFLLGVSNADILNIRGTKIDLPAPKVSRSQARLPPPVKHDEKSVHHFCIEMFNENDSMPRDLRAMTQLYHQRARFRHQLPMDSTYYKHGKLPNVTTEETNREIVEDEERGSQHRM